MKKKFGAFGARQFSLETLVGGRPGTTIFQKPGGGGGLGGVAYKDRAWPPPRARGPDPPDNIPLLIRFTDPEQSCVTSIWAELISPVPARAFLCCGFEARGARWSPCGAV